MSGLLADRLSGSKRKKQKVEDVKEVEETQKPESYFYPMVHTSAGASPTWLEAIGCPFRANHVLIKSISFDDGSSAPVTYGVLTSSLSKDPLCHVMSGMRGAAPRGGPRAIEMTPNTSVTFGLMQPLVVAHQMASSTSYTQLAWPSNGILIIEFEFLNFFPGQKQELSPMEQEEDQIPQMP